MSIPDRPVEPAPAPLTGLAVVDLTDGVAGQFAARLLADFGADVVLVEQPNGTSTRREHPLRTDGSSLLFWHLNTSKRSVCADETTLDGLVATADVVIGDRDIDVDGLCRRHPRLVGCMLHEFLPGGPYENWKASDLIHQALSGLAHATGRADREPLFGVGRRAYYSAGAAAVVAVGAALHERARSGRGQLIDISVHETAAAMSQNLVTQFSYSGFFPTRGRYAGASGTFECRDAWVVMFCPPGRWPAMCTSLGLAALGANPRFNGHDRLVAEWATAGDELAAAIRPRAADDIVAAILAGRCMAARVYTPNDVVECAHLAARDFWRSVPMPDGTSRPILGPTLRFAGCEERTATPAPDVCADDASPVPIASSSAVPASLPTEPPLRGVRVLELTSAWAGPMSARILAALGADVLKVESDDVMDAWRGPPANGDPNRYPDRDPGARPYNRNAWFNTQNHAKRSLALDLKSPGAAAILDRLLPTVDVVVCNYARDVLERLGLGFEAMRAKQPRIVLVEMPVAGGGGPLSAMAGVGPTMEALSGMTAMIGYGDGVPTSTGPAILDPMGSLNAAMAVVVALRARDATGRPQRVELAQRDAALHWIGEWLLEAAETGDWSRPDGNAVAWAAPHGIYRAKGDDEWVAVAVETDGAWAAFCTATGRPALAGDPRFTSADRRIANRAVVDQLVSEWTATLDKAAGAAILQRHGVPAAPVLSGADVHDDAHLRASGFYVEVEHPEAGRHRYQGLPFHFCRTATRYGAPAPCLGQHTAEVLAELGLTDAEIHLAIATGAAICTDDAAVGTEQR